MILRNGIRSNLRARGRTALFGLLLFGLTVLLTLGLGLWRYCSTTLAQMDETYTSVALVEYLGADYPEDDAADGFARQALATIDAESADALDGVVRWMPTDRTLARVEGYERSSGERPYKSNAVVYCYSVKSYYQTLALYDLDEATGQYYQTGTEEVLSGYNATLGKSLYTLDGAEEIFIRIDAAEYAVEFEPDKRYLLHGEFIDSNSAIKTLALTAFPGGEEALPYREVEGPGDPALTDPDSPFVQYAGLYQTMNNAVELTASNDIAALEAFHQSGLTLAEGRFPEADEPGVCLVSGKMAQQLGLTLGDTLELELLPASEGDRFRGYLPGMELEARSLTVVGITSESNGYPGSVWVSAAEGCFAAPLFGYTLATAVLENETAQQTAEALQAMMPDQVRVTLYDQGYAAAAEPLQTLRTTALALTLASGAGALAALLLFAYLFVGRQQETVALLHALGTPKPKILLWMLSGAAVIAGCASLLGGVTGGLLLDRVLNAALGAAQGLHGTDQRYSEALVGLRRQLDAAAPPAAGSALAAVALVCGTALALCLVFLRSTQRRQAPKRGKLKVRVPRGGTSVRGRGALRYAVLAIRRGGLRALLAPAATLVLTLLLGILAGTATGWQNQLDTLYADSQIEGMAVSTDGRTAGGLTVSSASARQLARSGYLEGFAVSQSFSYAPVWQVPDFANTSFGAETKLNWLRSQADAVFLNDLTAAPEFYYSDAPAITWLDGWDESFLLERELPFLMEALTISHGMGKTVKVLQEGIALQYPALVSERFLQANGLKLGDEFEILVYFETTENILNVTVTAVGSFAAQSAEDNLYLPLKGAFDPEWLFGEEDVVSTVDTALERRNPLVYYYNKLKTSTFETLRFTATDAARLEEFRGWLAEQGYGMVGALGRNRTTLLLRDGSFTQAVSALERYITFGGLLTPVLLAVVGLLGFLISWLLTNGRRMEFAVMRGLGASRRRVFFSFFWEQAALCLLGCVPAGCVLSLLGNAPLRWLAAEAFALCYLTGAAVSVLVVGRTNLMDLLSERE